jgi:hypothetical protein
LPKPQSTITSIPATTVPPTTIPPTAVPTATAPETAALLSIQQFDVLQIEEMNPGKRITFQWAAVGADEVCLVSGTSRRLNPWWGRLPLEGILTVEVAGTLYRDPQFTLQAFTGEDICLVPEAPPASENRVTAAITISAWLGACAGTGLYGHAPNGAS